MDYIIGRNGGIDPAYGCMKNFTSTYQCGNGPNKTVSITGDKVEAGGQPIKFDCSAEHKICGGFRLMLGDDGNLTLTDSNSDIVWQSNTKSTGLELEKYKASNGKYGRNYLLSGETLKTGEFIGSPSGNCFLIMNGNKNDCTQNGLQLSYNVVNCNINDTINKHGNDPTTNGLYSIKKYNSNNVGKVGYIDETNKIHEYSPDMISQGTTYTFLGNYNSTGKDISQIKNAKLDNCKTNCNSTSNCNGFVFKDNTCFLKNSDIFPKGVRTYSKESELYIRDKKVNNNYSCSKVIDSSYASDWDLLPPAEKMSLDTLCALGAVTQDELTNMETQQTNMTKIANQLQNKFDSIKGKTTKFNNTFTQNNDKLNKDIKKYSSVYDKIRKNTSVLDNIISISDDTKISISSQKIKFFIWTNLAIILAIITMRLVKK
jgi:hypothetical protein